MSEPHTISGDIQFAEVVVREGYASEVQVQECLRIQADLQDKGNPRQLGAIMVERGYLSIQQVEEILDKLNKRTLECSSCGGRFTVRGWEPGQQYSCPRCNSTLEAPAESSEEISQLPDVAATKLDPENLVNHTIGGCKVLEKLAIGGMGTIYKARQLSMNRLVVVKTLSEDLAKDKAYVQRFLQEARAAGELSHMNLIHVMDVGYQDGVFYYIMEFIDGINLDTILAQKGRIPVDQTVDIIIQTARALEQAHSRNIIHRDIKPDNIMITRDGVVKLADLGIAKKMSSDMGVTEPGMVLGTPFYMAPEQGRDSRSVDHRSDIYGLGATMYHMLSGNVPFDGKTTLEIVMKSIEEDPPPLKEVDASLSDDVCALVEKMMKKRPEERYQSMSDVISDLERLKAHKTLEWVEHRSSRHVTPPPIPAAPPRPSSGSTKKHPSHGAVKAVSRTPTPTPTTPKGPPKLSAAKRKELGLDDSDFDEAKPAAATPPPASKPVAPGRPLPQKAAPATAKVAGILADSQGATPGKIYKERERDLVWPIVTVLGVAVSVFIAFRLLHKSGEESSNTGSGTGPIGVHSGDPGSGGVKAGDYDTPYAQQSLKDAKKYEADFPNNLDEQIDKYLGVADGFKGTVSATEARKLYDERVKKRDELLQKAYEEVLGKIEVGKASSEFGEALTALDEFEAKKIPDEWKQKVQSDREALLKLAHGVYDKVTQEADEAYNAGELQKAIDILQKYFNLGVESLTAKIDKRLSVYDEEGDRKIEEAMNSYRRLREVNDGKIKPVDELQTKMKFGDAKKRLEEISRAGNVKMVKPVIERDMADIDTVLSVIKAAGDGVEKSKGQDYEFQLRGSEPHKAAGKYKGKIVDIKDGKITVDDGKPHEIDVTKLMDEQIVEMALRGLPADAAQSEQDAGVYCLVMDDPEAAERHFLAAEGKGGDVGAYLTRIEDLRVKPRLPAEPQVLYFNTQGAPWQQQGGTWREHQQEGYIEGGETQGNWVWSPPAGFQKVEEYVYKARAKKVKGLNGFVLGFHAFGKDLLWNFGDDMNKVCWVEGAPVTRRTQPIEDGIWYSVRIVITKNWAVAYVNNRRQWRIALPDVQRAEPGMPCGFGFGVVATKACFRDLKIWPLK